MDGLDEALAHIARHSSAHTEAMITEDSEASERFLAEAAREHEVVVIGYGTMKKSDLLVSVEAGVPARPGAKRRPRLGQIVRHKTRGQGRPRHGN